MSPLDHPTWGGARPNAGRKPAPKDNDSSYSLSRALLSMLDRGAPTGIEADYHFSEALNRSKLPPNSPLSTPISNLAVLHVPFEGLRRDVSAGNTGASLIGEEKQLVSPLLTWSAAVQAGATVLEGLRENVSLARVSKLPEPVWQPETGFVIETDPEFASVLLGPPRRVCGLVRVSQQLLMSASPGLDQLLIDDLARACSSQFDRIVFYGTGTDNQPLGIANTPLIHRVNVGVTIPGWEDFCEAERLIEEEDVGLNNFAFVTQPDLKAELRRRPQWTDAGRSIWEALPRTVSSKAITGEHDVFFGEFGFLVVGIWGESADVLVNRFTQSRAGQVDISVNLWCNLAIRSPRLFGLMNVEYLHRIARKAEEEKEPAKSESGESPEKGNNKKK